MHFRWKYAFSHYMVLTTIQVFIIWNDFIRLHTFQNGKRSKNVDRPQVAKCKSTLKYRVSPQKSGHYLISCNVKAQNR
jgi:hypothetical protein